MALFTPHVGAIMSGDGWGVGGVSGGRRRRSRADGGERRGGTGATQVDVFMSISCLPPNKSKVAQGCNVLSARRSQVGGKKDLNLALHQINHG